MPSRNLPRYNGNAGRTIMDRGPIFTMAYWEVRTAGNDILTIEKNRLKSCKITEEGIVYVSHSDF